MTHSRLPGQAPLGAVHVDAGVQTRLGHDTCTRTDRDVEGYGDRASFGQDRIQAEALRDDVAQWASEGTR